MDQLRDHFDTLQKQVDSIALENHQLRDHFDTLQERVEPPPPLSQSRTAAAAEQPPPPPPQQPPPPVDALALVLLAVLTAPGDHHALKKLSFQRDSAGVTWKEGPNGKLKTLFGYDDTEYTWDRLQMQGHDLLDASGLSNCDGGYRRRAPRLRCTTTSWKWCFTALARRHTLAWG